MMTDMLDAAVAKLAALPPEEQDRFARWLLEELAAGNAVEFRSRAIEQEVLNLLDKH